jgi:predicted ATPase/signal transduction histidine kinase
MGGLAFGRPGEIYRGTRYVVTRRTQAGLPVVVKAVRPEYPDLAGARARLSHEHELLVDLRLPGIVRVAGLEPADAEGASALVLEDAGNQTLKQWQLRRPLSPEPFLTLAIGLAEVLSRLHERNIIHRDINPTNVVIGEQGRVTLIDFDAATATAGPAQRTGVPAHRGAALPYISPEETGRVGRLVDARADLYSLGATFYELLTGAPPFVTSDPVDLVHAHLARMPFPPAQANPAVPGLLSDLVLKLLAKMPEARYQSAQALLSDLREAENRLRRHGAISRFELGLADLDREMPLPETLYQRESERAALLAAWDRVAGGGRELLLIGGPAGVGKSALAAELRGPVVGRNGRLLEGRCEVRRSSTPYAPVVQALQQLVSLLQSEPEGQAAPTRQRLRAAVGVNARLLSELCPAIEPLLGSAPALAELPAPEAEQRFAHVLRSFVRALASDQHPLVLLLEDLQWADAGTLRLLRVLVEAPPLERLLLVATFRSEELHPQHPTRLALDALSADREVESSTLDLPPLQKEAITAICCQALRCDHHRGGALAELVLRKTGGNPFFIRRLLRFLHKEALLGLDPATGAWRWDLAQIENVGVSDNVVDVLVAGLGRLPGPVQQVVHTAACLGDQARLGLIAAVAGQTEGGAAESLQVAVGEGLLVPVDGEGALAQEGASFRCVHDRIQQAAYSRLSSDDRRAIHRRAARQLLVAPARAVDERLFAVVDQFEAAAPLTDASERLEVAALNLRATVKARLSSAYVSAHDYVRRGIALLPSEVPPERRALAFDLHREALECASLLGLWSEVPDRERAALEFAARPTDRAEVYRMRAVERIRNGVYDQAMEYVKAGLSALGIELPAGGDPEPVRRELAALSAKLASSRLEDVLDRPAMQDPDLLAACELLATALTPTYFLQQHLWPFVLARVVNLSLQHGMARSSPFAFACCGVLVQRSGDHHSGHRLAQLGVELARRMADPVELCRAVGVFTAIVRPWQDPIDLCLPLLRETQAAGLAAGELTFAFTATSTAVALLFHRGLELPRVLAEIERGLALMNTTRIAAEQAMLSGYKRVIHRLMGLSAESACIEPDRQRCRHQTIRMGCAYLFGDLAGARELAAEARPLLPSATRSVMIVEHAYYDALTLAASCAQVEREQLPRLVGEIAAHQAQFAVWAGHCPDNYQHKHLLLQAELARVQARPYEAAERYDEAIEAAAQQGFLQDQALASELCGRFHRGLGRRRFAGLYLNQALAIYLRWGARAKAEALESEFPELRLDLGPPAPAQLDPVTDDAQGHALDLMPLFRAAEAIAGEVVLSRLLGKLMALCLASAGAERSALVLEEPEGPFVRALGSISDGTTLLREPVGTGRHVAAAIVERARRSGQMVVLADAAADEELAEDRYVRERGVRSVLALPIVRQTKLFGVLYLENNLATRVFTAERGRLLQLLSAQIAAALENSLLFEELTHEIEDRERAETAVRFLAESGAALSESLDYERTLAKVARLAVSFIADWCTVDLLEQGEVQRVALAHRDPAGEERLRELRQRQGPEGPRETLRAVERGRPVLFTDVSDQMLERFGGRPELRDLVREIGAESGMILPLVAGDRRLGAISLVSSNPDRRYGPKDLALAEELARRAALAIDNARLYREAREAIRLRDEFLSIASHELNTPIASLQLLAQAMEEAGPGKPGPALHSTVAIISRQSRRLAGLVREMLDVSRLQGKWLQLNLQPVDLGELLRETVTRFGEDVRRAGCQLTVNAANGVVGQWDRVRMDQVIANLLGNAIKFAPGKPIDIMAQGDEGRAQLQVRDHGIGIQPERIPHIFGRFERAVSADHYGGLGLGLYIVHEIITAHRGTVRVESAPGIGSTFTVELPLTPG